MQQKQLKIIGSGIQIAEFKVVEIYQGAQVPVRDRII
jgi:hypothetical protein